MQDLVISDYLCTVSDTGAVLSIIFFQKKFSKFGVQ